ncbi:ABC transporter substrate-binding protein [Streptomyces sp. NRRL B-24572]|uniref:ABC transporter substrate-binding protein n=1 Tax=Streptomyces sp. NRRL B-24572 TaxID=1962156 RepID=UPI000A369019|nr:extracellular solute-binding protein [Streptomyces sp. NRRL B-24572]
MARSLLPASRTVRVAGAVTAAALLLGLTACGGDDAGDGKSFTYWSMWRAEEPQAQVIKAAIADFTASTGIKVEVNWAGRDVSKKIGPAIAANQAPDLWDQANDAIFGATASAGQARDLSSVLAMQVPGENVKVSDVIPDKYFAMLPKDPSGSNHYVIPYEVATTGMYYNAADPAVTAAMPNPPADWDAFLKICDAVEAKGKACVASEGEDPWTNGLYLDYLLNAGGVDVARLSADKTGAAWDDPAVLAAAGKIEKLVKGGHVIKGYDATKYPAQQTNWAAGKAGFLMNGSWVTAEVAQQIPSGWKFGSLLPPGATTPDAALFGFSVPKRAKNAGAAEKFIAYFLQKKTLSGIATKAANITPREDIPAPAELADAQKALSSPKVRLAFDGVAGSWSPKVLDRNFLDLWHGKTTAAQFVAACKAAQVSYWKSQG